MSTLHSPRWHRVAALKPRLAPSLRVRRQHVRGWTWIVLSGGSGRSVRLERAAWALAGRFDGRSSVQQLWDQAMTQAADPPTQDEVIDLLAQLREAALLQFDRGADFDRLLPQLQRTERTAGSRSLLAWRVPVADPSALLARLHVAGRLSFSLPAAWLWAAAMLSLLLLALQHGPALWAHGAQWLTTPRYALLAALLYVPVKALHELAHGLAVQRWGGVVREAGVTLMLGLPVPYVDASAAAAFVQRRCRVVVGAAGIMAELALAAAALPLWLWLDDGLAREVAFVVLFITGVSTLLFNANPLQRLDGYFIATDALDLPNLAPRSRRWWSEKLQSLVAPSAGSEPMTLARGETPWLVAYAPLSWSCQVLVAALAVVWLGSVSFALGCTAGLLLGWQVGVRPALRLLAPLRGAALAQSGDARRWRSLLAGGAVAVLAVLALPLPQHTLVQGIVWPPDEAQLRSDEDGFVELVLAADGQTVTAGSVVLQLANPRLQSELQRQQARVSGLETRLYGALPGGSAAASGDAAQAQPGDAEIELTTARATLEHLQQRVDALAVRARAGGRLALPHAADLPGHYVARGRLLGQVLDAAPPTVRVALPEAEAAALRAAPREVSVRLAATPALQHRAELLRDGGAAQRQLPSAALADRHGGAIATDPRDPEALRSLKPVLLFDVRLPAGVGNVRLGERAWVRVDTGWAPLAAQAARALRSTLLQRFNAAF